MSKDATTFCKGDIVRIVEIPESLIHDLPDDEKVELKSYEGKLLTIEKIDEFGFVWFGVGATKQMDGISYYSGHSFCLEARYVSAT